jgi:subtilase family serine protease
VNENGGPNLPRSNTGWDQEQALDLDMVSTMCPNCKILLVQASSSSFADLAAAANYAGMHAHVVSNSYGGGENGSNTYEASYNHNGVAVTASTGDSGFGAQFPATSPHVIAVGGTTLHLTGSNTRQSETAWSGGGSGCSTLYNEPSWQLPSNANMTTNTLCPANRRGSAWLVFGGTSVAAPLIGGIFGEKNNAVNFAQTIYTNSSSLFDVTSGTNGSCGGTYFCVAGPHYDGPTGLGTPNGDTAF